MGRESAHTWHLYHGISFAFYYRPFVLLTRNICSAPKSSTTATAKEGTAEVAIIIPSDNAFLTRVADQWKASRAFVDVCYGRDSTELF